MESDTQWFDNDEFWEKWQPWLFAEPRLAHAAEEVSQALTLLKIEPGARVLDLGCGVGRHSLELARRGFRVTGVDRTASYLEQSRGKAAQAKLEAEFVQSDMREFLQPGAFDAAINLFTTFGYFRDPQDDLKVMRNVCRSLKPGGAFLMDTHGKETLSKIFQKRMWHEYGGMIVLNEVNVTQTWSWIQARWLMFRGSERIEHTVEHRLYAGSELAALFGAGGFSRVEVYGDMEGHPYDETARRLVVVGRK